jgi:hypothetical protein
VGRKATTGLWITPVGLRRLDRRTRLAKALRAVKQELTVALGGDLSPQQEILVDRAAFLVFRVSTFEGMLIAGKEYNPSVDNIYLCWCNTLRRTLEALGLKRVARDLNIVAELARLAHEDPAP